MLYEGVIVLPRTYCAKMIGRLSLAVTFALTGIVSAQGTYVRDLPSRVSFILLMRCGLYSRLISQP